MLVEIIRIEKSENIMLGALKLNGKILCLTLELPFNFNTPNISCIPENIYLCSRKDSPKFGNTFEIVDVPYRTNILFHTGNTVEDTLGCILLGNSLGSLKGERAILQSGVAFKEFMSKLKDIDHFSLHIM